MSATTKAKNPLYLRRYLGLALAGAKSKTPKTTLSILEFYPKEKKIFVLDVFEKIGSEPNLSSDEVLLETIEESKDHVASLGVNVPLSLPPCIICTRKKCPLPKNCTVPSVKWMNKATHDIKTKKTFTPYTQRPVEIWIKNKIKKDFDCHLDIDETLGGTHAPLTARMNFLLRHLGNLEVCEVVPKLSLLTLNKKVGISNKLLKNYRDIETGASSRYNILEIISQKLDIFIYERDLRKIAENISSFDSFMCAYTALLDHQNQCYKRPKDFPKNERWISFPKQ